MRFFRHPDFENAVDNLQQRQYILIVDDQPANLISYEALLEDFDATLLTATSGSEALALLLRYDVALVLLDVQMPGMDGFEVAHLMRKSRRTQSVPIIFVTAISKEQRYVFRGYEAGAVDYLTKPIEPEILRRKARVFLDLDAKNKQLRDSLDVIRKSLREVQELKDRNDLLLRSVGEGILGLDTQGYIIFANPAAESALVTHDQTLINTPIADYFLTTPNPEDRLSWLDSAIYESCSRGVRYEEQYDFYAYTDNRVFPVEITATPMMTQLRGVSEFAGVVLVFKDITDRQATEQQLRQLAQYDTLTGLANRNLLSSVLLQSLMRAENSAHELVVLYLDIDRFKMVNDSFGHDLGDLLLQDVAARLRDCVRDTDFIARVGGDEFTLLLETTDGRHTANLVASKIIQSIAQPFVLQGHEMHVGASLGVVIYPEAKRDAYGLMRCADLAMYKAKSMGRNNFQFFTSELESQISESVRLENRLRRALEQGEMFLVFQPQLNFHTSKIVGFEALLRWHPEGMDPVSPVRFIPLAEDTGMIVEIGEWVLREACRQLVAWQRLGLCGKQQKMAVNLSVRQLREADLVSRVRKILTEEHMDPACLELEITESMLVDDPEAMSALLREISQLGINLSVDDFGTGYSSMLYLKQMPINAVKIDRTFIKDIERNNSDAAITRGVIALAHSLSLQVVAEGVETSSIADFLQANGCDMLQGYWFCHPLTVDRMSEFLRHHAARVH